MLHDSETMLERVVRISVPQYPDLCVMSHNPEHFPPSLLQRIAHEVSQLLKRDCSQTLVTSASIKAWLHEIHAPLRLALHPLAQPWQHLPLDQHSAACAVWLRQMIQQLEFPETDGEATTPGTIMRLRFLDGLRCKDIMLRLNISERHYHRLQDEGLQWIVEQYHVLWSESESLAERTG